MKKLKIISFFLVVFGLPSIWYLFLQFFGENRFDVPVLGVYNKTCLMDLQLVDRSALIIYENFKEEKPNEWDRITKKISRIGTLIEIREGVSNCFISDSICFIDHLGMIRGLYGFDREEADRLLTELDIYLLNESSDN